MSEAGEQRLREVGESGLSQSGGEGAALHLPVYTHNEGSVVGSCDDLERPPEAVSLRLFFVHQLFVGFLCCCEVFKT